VAPQGQKEIAEGQKGLTESLKNIMVTTINVDQVGQKKSHRKARSGRGKEGGNSPVESTEKASADQLMLDFEISKGIERREGGQYYW